MTPPTPPQEGSVGEFPWCHCDAPAYQCPCEVEFKRLRGKIRRQAAEIVLLKEEKANWQNTAEHTRIALQAEVAALTLLVEQKDEALKRVRVVIVSALPQTPKLGEWDKGRVLGWIDAALRSEEAVPAKGAGMSYPPSVEKKG